MWPCKVKSIIYLLLNVNLKTRFCKKLKIELSYDPAISLLGTYPEKTKTLIWKDTGTPIFTASLFTKTKTWEQPKCPLTDEWIKKMCVCVWGTEYCSAIKRMRYCHLWQHGWTMEISILSEVSQTKTKSMIPLHVESKKKWYKWTYL